MKMQLQPLTPAALYARVSSDRQDVDLSVAAQLRALRDYAKANSYVVAREYVDEAESGRIADRPEFRNMIDEGSRTNAPFQVILVWKFSRFTRKREHAVGLQVHAETQGHPGRLHYRARRRLTYREAHGGHHRECGRVLLGEPGPGGNQGNAGVCLPWLLPSSSKAPFGYKRIKVLDGAKERPTLAPDPDTAPIVREVFQSSLRGNGLQGDMPRSLTTAA